MALNKGLRLHFSFKKYADMNNIYLEFLVAEISNQAQTILFAGVNFV